MMPTKIVKPDGTGDYTSIQAWATAVSALSGTQDAECTGAVGALTISAWTPTSSRIYPASGQQHSLNLTGSTMAATSLTSAGGMTIEGMRMTSTLAISNCGPTIKNSIVGAATTVGVSAGSIAPTFNNSVFTSITVTSAAGLTISVTLNNCFLSGALTWTPNGGTVNMTCKNTMAASFSNADESGATTMSNNLSADNSADDWGGTGHLLSKPLASQVINTASNWKLRPSSVCRNAGVTIAATANDALGSARLTGKYDIGPFELDDSAIARVMDCMLIN